MKRVVLSLLFGLVLLTFESVVVKYLEMPVSRIDVTVGIITFLALRSFTLEGAFSAFGLGYLLDLMSGRPTGLYTFLAVLTFLAGRLAGSLVEVRNRVSFTLFATGAEAGHALLAMILSWMVTADSAGLSSELRALPLQIALTGLCAFAFHPLFRYLDPGDARVKPGFLRG